MKIEDLCSATFTFDNPVCFLQNAADVTSLNLLERRNSADGLFRFVPVQLTAAASPPGVVAMPVAGSRSAPSLKIGPRDRTTARSTTFCNSRMFPGQSYLERRSIASCAMPVICLPNCRAYLSTKKMARSGMQNGAAATAARQSEGR